jgi:hypothetical protein
MLERNWKLNDDLLIHDNLFDGITFDDIITMLICNEKAIDKTTVKKCFNELLESRLEDARDLLDINIEEIAKEARKHRND